MSRRIYAACALALFCIEVIIALFVRDAFVRPYLGDALAVACVYCVLRAGLPLALGPALAVSLVLAAAIEMGQYVHVLDLLGLAGNGLARTVLGYGFEWADFIAYAAGGAGVMLVEYLVQGRRSS